MFNPPSKTNWAMAHSFMQEYADEYKRGYEAAKAGGKESDNPNKLSGHERDTTFSDELNYHWWKGFNDYEAT